MLWSFGHIMKFKLNPNRAFITLIAIAVVFAVLHIVARSFVHFTDVDGAWLKLFTRFDMNQEVSVPTWYNQILLFIAAGIATVTGLVKREAKDSYTKHWLGLGAIFTYMSIDEGASLHEIAAAPLGNYFGTGGTLLHYAWVIAGMAFLGVFGLIYFRFWLKLPKTTRFLFALAAIIYVGGAVGTEMIAGYYASNYGQGFQYSLLTLAEEGMEKTGVIVFIYALLKYLESIKPNLSLQIKSLAK